MQAHRDVVQECETITQKIDALLAELQELKRAVEARPSVGTKPLPWNQAITGLGAFERVVLAEKRNVDNMLKQATDYDDDTDLDSLVGKLRIKLDACNHKFHDAVWDTAKKCHDLSGLRCEYYRTPANRKAESVIVDIVASGGTEWIKIVTTTERRICYEMTDAGWDWEVDDDDDQGLDEPPLAEDGDSEVEVARVARHLVAAASMTYVDYRRPSIKIILSRITSGSNAHVDRLLRYVRTFGRDDIKLSIETLDQSELLKTTAPPLEVALPSLVSHDPFRDFTSTLNVDCSVFMALASDFSHMSIVLGNPLLRSHQHRIDASDEMEHGPRLLTTLYPAMVGRDLVCTQDAADTFLKIAYDIGTETEQARARILFKTPEDETDSVSAEEDRRRRVAQLAELSVYDVPDDLRLPIRTVGTVTWEDAQRLVQEKQLPQVALVVGKMGSGLNAMNVSSFLYGWKATLTTITSNWEAAKRLRTVIESNRTAADERGPHIWRIPFARKLLAKPKVTGIERPPLKTRRERKQEKLSSLQRWVGDDNSRPATEA